MTVVERLASARASIVVAAVFATTVVTLLAATGCGQAKAEPGTKIACTCTFLTDYDDAARVDVDVCVGEGKDVQAAAKACAARSAHNHVEGCQCKTPAAKSPCDAAAKDACDAH